MELFSAVLQISTLSEHDLGYQLSRRYDLYKTSSEQLKREREIGRMWGGERERRERNVIL